MKKPGLQESVAELEEENTRLKARIAELEARIAGVGSGARCGNRWAAFRRDNCP
jgi:hypothetical protein